jgi:hypothetical protein
MKRLSNVITPVSLADGVSALTLPPAVYALVPEGWQTFEGTIPEFDLEVWATDARALTAATLYGAAVHPHAIANFDLDSVNAGTETFTKTGHGLFTGDGPIRFTSDDLAATKASLDLAPITAVIETVVQAANAGDAGNDITLALTADGTGVGTLDESAFPIIVFHYETAVTTVGDFEDAITASVNLQVKTADGTPATVLTIVNDDFTATNLTNGTDDSALPAGIDVGVDYWVIKTTDDAFKLADSLRDAFDGIYITIGDAGVGVITVSDTADTSRAYWHSHGLLGPASDGAITLTAQSAYLTRRVHHPRAFAYAVVATFGAGAGLVSVTMVPIVDGD